MTIFQLTKRLSFPPPQFASREGLLAIGGDLRPERLLLAYRQGIFPWFSDGDPILWWSPDPRMILYPREMNISRSLKKTIRRRKYTVTFDHAFHHVIENCASLRVANGEGTWITDEMKEAYRRLHHLGYAHSVETWFNQRLVGGLYGVSLGRSFFGESMFSTMSDSSKVALAHLAAFMIAAGFDFIDCQMATDHLKSLGAREIPRKTFLKELQESLDHPSRKGSWKSLYPTETNISVMP